jgi:hypothetical protein
MLTLHIFYSICHNSDKSRTMLTEVFTLIEIFTLTEVIINLTEVFLTLTGVFPCFSSVLRQIPG